MKILTIDTTTKHLYAIVIDGEKAFNANILNCQNKHSESLCLAIQQVLDAAKLSLDQLDAYAVATGPGSFTGIRIAVSTIKGIATALPKKFISINNLAVVATNQKATKAVIDAGNGWYFQDFAASTPPILLPYDDEKVQNAAKFCPDTDYTDTLVKLSKQHFLAGNFVEALTPLYIRKSQAEENLRNE